MESDERSGFLIRWDLADETRMGRSKDATFRNLVGLKRPFTFWKLCGSWVVGHLYLVDKGKMP